MYSHWHPQKFSLSLPSLSPSPSPSLSLSLSLIFSLFFSFAFSSLYFNVISSHRGILCIVLHQLFIPGEFYYTTRSFPTSLPLPPSLPSPPFLPSSLSHSLFLSISPSLAPSILLPNLFKPPILPIICLFLSRFATPSSHFPLPPSLYISFFHSSLTQSALM